MEDLSVKFQKLRRYDIVRPVGEGAKGKVYLAQDRIIRRPVAIKIFSLDTLADRGAPKDKILREFFLETQTAGALLHPNIVVIYDLGIKYDLLYIVMEFVYGKTILEHQQSSGFTIEKSVELVYELAQALDYAHSRNVIHRDIKPENIIVSQRGIPKITDFGIARFREHLKKERRYLIGSTRFLAPEQVLHLEQDGRVDIYQLGVVFFELLTRRALFKGSSPEETMAKICHETPPPPRAVNPQVPEEIDLIVARCLEKSPGKRFPRARDLAAALGSCLRSGIHTGIAPDRGLVEDLKKFEMFSLFTDTEIRQVARMGEFVTCPRGGHIIRENEADSNFFVLLEGSVKVVKGSRVLTNFLPGDCFGEIGAFARQRRSAAVVAEEDSKLLQINALLFKDLDPALQVKMLHVVLRNLSRLVISLDKEIVRQTNGKGTPRALPNICPICGFDNNGPIEVCPRCGVIPGAIEDPTVEKE